MVSNRMQIKIERGWCATAYCFWLFFFLSQRLMEPRLMSNKLPMRAILYLNTESPCFYSLNTGITSIYYHDWMEKVYQI